MAGSPRYLRLLHEITMKPPVHVVASSEWDYLEHCWNRLTTEQNTDNLYELAGIVFQILAHETRQSMADVMDEAKALHIAKNAGYAGASNPDPWANFRLSTVFSISPVRGVYVRMSDKYIRVTNLRADASNERVGESLLDTLRDLGAYALIAMCLLEEEQQAQKEPFHIPHHSI